MIPAKLQEAFDEAESLKEGKEINTDRIVGHNTPQGRVKTLQIRLTDDEYSRLAELAGDKPVSAIARNLLFAATQQDNPEQLLAQQALQEALEAAGYRITKAA